MCPVCGRTLRNHPGCEPCGTVLHKFACYDADRPIRTVVCDPTRAFMTNGDIVDQLNDQADEIARLRTGLGFVSQLLNGSARISSIIAQATLDGANLLDEDVAIEVCEGHWKPR